MIELPKGLVIIADEHCYIMGKPKKDRGRGVEIQNPKLLPHNGKNNSWRSFSHNALKGEG